jgi:hypothetical protein
LVQFPAVMLAAGTKWVIEEYQDFSEFAGSNR